MKAIRLPNSVTIYTVISDTLSCSFGVECGWSTSAKFKHTAGDPCPKCGNGRLEYNKYQVDIAELDANGACGCVRFEQNLRLKIENTPPDQRKMFRYQCKHIVLARIAAGLDENLDALLGALTQQSQEQHA